MQKKRWFMLVGVVVAVLSLSVLVAACGGDDDGDGNGDEPPAATEPADDGPEATEPANGTTGDDGGTVEVSQNEWSIGLSQDSVGAGTVTFALTNEGTILHNFLVAKTDLGPAELPVDSATFMVDEDALDIRATSSDLEVAETEDLVADLEPGSYVLFCNIPSHYEAGVYAGFTVE